MECRVCGNKTKKSFLCKECEEKINFLSTELTYSKRKINMQFDEHRFFTRDQCG